MESQISMYGKAVADGIFLYGAMTVYWMLYTVPILHGLIALMLRFAPGTLVPHVISYIVLIAAIFAIMKEHTDVKEGIWLGVVWAVVYIALDALFAGITFASHALVSYLILTTYGLILIMPVLIIVWRGASTQTAPKPL